MRSGVRSNENRGDSSSRVSAVTELANACAALCMSRTNARHDAFLRGIPLVLLWKATGVPTTFTGATWCALT